MDLWGYKAKVIDVISGDTIEVDIDLGFGKTTKQIVRINNIKAIREESKEALSELILGKYITIETKKQNRKYVAEVYMKYGEMNNFYINLYLVEAGHAYYSGSLRSKGTNQWPGITTRT